MCPTSDFESKGTAVPTIRVLLIAVLLLPVGYSQEEVTEEGARQLDIHKLKNGIFTRGVLFDITRLEGVPYLEPGTPIFPEDLEALGQAAAERERWGFLLTTAPIPVEGGTGSPMNPIAVF